MVFSHPVVNQQVISQQAAASMAAGTGQAQGVAVTSSVYTHPNFWPIMVALVLMIVLLAIIFGR